MSGTELKKSKYKNSTIAIIFLLAWPTMFEQLMQTAVQYIDTAMVGSLGTVATAAVGSTTTVNWLVGSTISAIGVGFLAFISQNHGAGNLELVKKASAQAMMVVIVTGVLVTAITLSLSHIVPILMQVDENIQAIASTYFFILYTPMIFRTATIVLGTILRSVGDTKTPMRVGIIVNIVNVVLNYLFIYESKTVYAGKIMITIPGLNLGVIGAGIASAIAIAVGGILIFISYIKHPLINPRGYSMKPDMEILRPCFKVAMPNALQRFGTSLGYVVFASMVNSLGEISTAAHTIANTVESAFYIPGYGMQTAAATLAGNAYGAKNAELIKRLGKFIIIIEVTLMLLSGSLLFIFAPNMMRIFSRSEEVIHLGTIVLKMVALSEPLYGVSIVIEGMLQGMGKTVMPLICNISGMWGIRIVGTFICIYYLKYSLISAWACMIMHNCMLFVFFIIYYNRLRKRNMIFE